MVSQGVHKFVAHSNKVLQLAKEKGWMAGARYTNLRDAKRMSVLGFLDIDWKNYDFQKHLEAAQSRRPFMTVARDIESLNMLDQCLREAERLSQYSEYVIVVPKAPELAGEMHRYIPKEYILGYSVQSSYGATGIAPVHFDGPVHLLGGRPDTQRLLADQMPVVSFDCNRFTYDARFGDYFDGEIFRPHPIGGYERCLKDSINNITCLWDDYTLDGSVTSWVEKSYSLLQKWEIDG